jgi:hypothetical protein
MSQDATPPSDSQESPLPTREAISEAASDVQAASTELGEIITKLEEFLEAKNIGVPAWVKVKAWSNERGEYWMREIGYDRFNSEWGLGIRERSGHDAYPDSESSHTWRFNSAPRKARISSVDKLPELLDALIKEATRTARRLREKTAEAAAFAATLNIAPPKKAKK